MRTRSTKVVTTMRDSVKKKGGRGHSREEWTQYHNRLVQLPDRMGGKQRAEKVVKLTELLRNRDTIVEHESTGRTSMSSKDVPGDGELENRSITKPVELSGKEVSEKTHKLSKNSTEDVE